MSETTLKEYIRPFNDTESFLKAVHIAKQLYSFEKTNYEQILRSVAIITKHHPNLLQIKSFVQQVMTYPQFYPTSFLANYDAVKAELHEYSCDNTEPNIILQTNVVKCFNCQYDEPNWFIYSAPPLQKKTILYRTDRIGKRNAFIIFA